MEPRVQILLNLGFDVNVAGHAAGAPASYWGEKNFGNKMKGQKVCRKVFPV